MTASAQALNQGRSLSLRRTIPNDAQLLFDKAFSRPDFMRLYNLNYLPANASEVQRHLVQRQHIPPDQEHYLELAIVHRQRGSIGICSLSEYSTFHRRAEYSIGLFDTEHRSVGHGLEASLLMLDLAFNRYRLHKLYAVTYSYNTNAQSGLTSLGFRLEGVRREHFFDPLSQSFVDLHDYGLMVHEFRANTRLIPLARRLLGREIGQSPESTAPNPPSQRFTQSGTILLGSSPP
jgi:RimJ/RimL family protein N-acetyltransferase